MTFGLGWVPTLFVATTALGYIVPYIIATKQGHVYYIFPAISDSGVHDPEALVFRELIDLSGFLSILNIYVRYKQYKLILEALPDSRLTWVDKLNSACLVIGVIGGVGVTFVANFKSKKAHPFAPVSEYSIHNIAAVVVFLTGLTYCAVQTYISEKAITYGVNTRSIYVWRLTLTVSILANFTVFMSGNFISNLKYDQEHWDDHPARKLHWRPGDAGYFVHVISNVAEWLMCLSFACFSLTFIPEFKKIRITSDFVEETHRTQLLSSNSSPSLDESSRTDPLIPSLSAPKSREHGVKSVDVAKLDKQPNSRTSPS